MNYLYYLLLPALIAGQLIKFPNSTQGGLTLLDILVVVLNIVGLSILKLKLKKPPLWVIAAATFTFFALTSLVFTPLKLSVSEYGISFSYLLRFMSYILLGWIVYSNGFPKLKGTAPIIAYSGLSLSILGFLQLVIFPDLSALSLNGWDPHYLRMTSTLLDPNFLGGFLTLAFLSILAAPTLSKYRKIFLSLIYLAIIFTFSRSAYFAFAVSLSTLSLLQKSPKMLLATALLVGGLGLGYLGYQRFIAQPRHIDRQQSAQFRMDSWQIGWRMFSSSPLTGIGFNAYRYALTEYRLAPASFTQSRGASANDSSLLFVLADAGTVGLAAYLFFLGSLFRQNKLLASGLTGILIQSFFINSLFYPWMLIWIVLTAVKSD